jgi:hypothetical protein
MTGRGRRRSYLLRVWEEPREAADLRPSRRALLRDLESGEERCFEVDQRIGGELVAYLDATGFAAAPDLGDPPAATVSPAFSAETFDAIADPSP